MTRGAYGVALAARDGERWRLLRGALLNSSVAAALTHRRNPLISIAGLKSSMLLSAAPAGGLPRDQQWRQNIFW